MRTPKAESGNSTPSTNTAKARVGECAFLKTVTVTRAGAFMDWGMERDLLVPVSQQLSPMVEGKSYVVYLFLDPKDQVIGTTKLHNFLDERAKNMAPGEEVDLLIVGETGLGYKAVINGTHLGLLYHGEIFRDLEPGERTRGFIKAIREDRKIDLALQRQTQQAREDLAARILAHLEANGGASPLTDYSPPEDIYNVYSVSKGNYKKALGKLYKQRLVKVEKDKITLLKP